MQQEPEDSYVDLIHVYLVYYKNKHQKQKSFNMFTDINEKSDKPTNECMEILFSEVEKLKDIMDKKYTGLYDTDKFGGLNDETVKDMYMVNINGVDKITYNLIYALQHIASVPEWINKEWAIYKIK